jgi:hypothetical protein
MSFSESGDAVDWRSAIPASSPGEGSTGRVVLVAVGPPDKRALVAARCAERIPAAKHRALHVATDPATAKALGLWWMDHEPSALRLEIIDDRGGVAATLAGVVRAQLDDGFEEVMVLVGHLPMGGIGRILLHDHTALSICAAMNRIQGAISALVPVDGR